MGAATSGLTPDRIQKHYRVPKSSTIRIVQNALVRHTGDSKPRSGRPKKLSIRDERYILRIVRRDPKITYKNLAEKAGVSVSHDTLYRLLKEEGITNWICKKRPLLTPEVAGKRYAWAMAHERWGFDEWAKVI
jgi:transposase